VIGERTSFCCTGAHELANESKGCSCEQGEEAADTDDAADTDAIVGGAINGVNSAAARFFSSGVDAAAAPCFKAP
jgi:hypothetical protein